MLDSPRPRERLPGLDILRGLAATSVMAFHFTTRFGVIFGHPAPPWILVPWGDRGVDVFFVISGFAIELSIESTNRARDFLFSRAVRLYPTFWAALALTFTVVGLFGLPDRVTSSLDALVNLSMIPGSLGARAVDAVYWTLERELRFYGLVLLLLALGLRRYSVHVLLVIVAVLAADATSHAIPRFVSDLLNAGWVHLFACGAILARFRHAAWWKTAGLLALCLGASSPIAAISFHCTAVAVALVWLATRPFVGARLRPLLFLGKISYPLYLVHQYIGYVLMRALYARGAPPSVAIASACAVAVANATALHFVIEKPCLELIRRFRRMPAAPAPQTAAIPA
jgi:peptidoglycan/LPS O-acetylase OafA/YrhL